MLDWIWICKDESDDLFIIIASTESAVSKILEMHDEHNLIWLAIS